MAGIIVSSADQLQFVSLTQGQLPPREPDLNAMDVRGLRQLVALADIRNYRRAAQRLGITHSALSLAISKLEAHYKVKLFQRGKGETQPTAFGRRIIKAARIALNEIQKAEHDIRLMQNMEAGRLVIGVDPTVSAGLLAPALTDLLKTWPKLRFTVVTSDWLTMEKDLRSSSIDVFIGKMPERKYHGISTIPLHLSSPIVACRPEHPLATGNYVSAAEVMEYPVMVGNSPDWFLSIIQKAYPDTFPNLDSLRSVFLTSHDMDLVRRMLPVSDSIALIPPSVVEEDIENGRLVELDVEMNPFSDSIPGIIATLESRPLPPAAKELISRIQPEAEPDALDQTPSRD